MSDKFQIVITGSNQAHAAFQQLTADAKAAGLSVEQMGEKSGRSLQQINQRAAAFGAALGGATLLMGEFAKAAAEDEASVARLEQSVTATGASFDDYSAAVDAAIKAGQEKAFTDTQTRDALVKLNLATGDTTKSLDELSLAMDFSRAKGVNLSTSAELIGKVMGGNLGVLTRYGIMLDENATKEEALAEVQKRVAGQAQTYADTSLGRMDIVKDKIDEMTEAWGAHAGAMQSVLLMLPGLQAGYVALAGVVGGMGGLGAIAKYGGPAAAVAGIGALAYGYSQDTLGTTQINSLANQFFLSMSSAINALTPGSVMDTQKYVDQMATNAQWDEINRALQAPGMSQDATAQALANLLGIKGATTTQGGVNLDTGEPFEITTTAKLSNDQILAAVSKGAAAMGIPIGQYIASVVGKSPGWTVDLVSGAAMPSAQYGAVYQTRVGAQYGYTGAPTMGYGAIAAAVGVGGVSPEARAAAMRPSGAPMEFDPSAMMARAGGIPAGGGSGFLLDAAANADKTTAALKKTYGAYYDLVTGMATAGEAASAFKITQDELIESQGVYSQQISEFSQQQNALTSARDVLITRQEEGVALTKEEQDLLDNYPQLYERVSGGVEDATIQQGLLAAAYIENMSVGDQLNETMRGTAESTGELVDIVRELILSLEGVPPETRARLELMGAEDALAELQSIVAHLNGLNGQTATFFVNEVRTGISVGSPSGVGPTVLHGGVVGYDNGGVVIHAGEAGPEYMSFANGGSAWAMNSGLYNVPRGTYVTPAPASVGKSSSGLHFNGPVSITVVANDPRQMAAAINEWAVGSSRS